MQGPTSLNPLPFALLLLVGFATLSHFGAHVRSVDAVGLSGSGFSLGIAASGLFAVIRGSRSR
jgi:hypothetical protein